MYCISRSVDRTLNTGKSIRRDAYVRYQLARSWGSSLFWGRSLSLLHSFNLVYQCCWKLGSSSRRVIDYVVMSLDVPAAVVVVTRMVC